MALDAQALPRERVPHASASSLNLGHSRDCVHYANASPWNLATMSFKQRVVRAQGCPRASSTKRVMRPRDQRDRVNSFKRKSRERVLHASASPAPHSLS